MVAKSKVKADDIHTSFNQLAHLVRLIGGGSKRGDDASLALVEVDLLENVLETNPARVLAHRLAPRLNHLQILS